MNKRPTMGEKRRLPATAPMMAPQMPAAVLPNFFGAHASGKLVNDHASRHQQRQDGPFPPRQILFSHDSLPDAPGRNDDNSGKHGDERADQPHAE
nr:hypothetical protein [Akkermansia muciniphila]